jgi:hypothetical protein
MDKSMQPFLYGENHIRTVNEIVSNKYFLKENQIKICILKIFSLHLQQLTLIVIKTKAYRRSITSYKN